jgi:phosphoribosylformylglycinamidine cyclo-ligase
MPVADYDMAGFAVGLVDRDRILGPHRVSQGDVLIGMRASGLHSNGYSLVRRLVEGLDLAQAHGLDLPLGEALLTPTAIYTRPCLALAEAGLVQALCHVTGGGLPGNLPRVLPEDLGVDVDTQTWEPGSLFELMRDLGDVETAEMFRVFNMGVGMVAVVRPDDIQPALSLLGEHGVTAWTMGTVTGPAGVRLH